MGPKSPPGGLQMAQEASRWLQEVPRRLQEALRRLQDGPKGAQDGPRGPQDGSKSSRRPPKAHSWTHPGPPKLEPKSTKHRSGTHSRFNNFFDWLLDRFVGQLGANLGQLGLQNGSNLMPSWAQNGTQNAIQEQLAHKSKNLQKCCIILINQGFWGPKLD